MEEIRKPDKKERDDERGPAQRARSAHSKFKKWFLASTAATALTIAFSCADHHGETYIPIPPGNEQVEGDGGHSPDGDTDSGTHLDGGPDLDADTDADTDSGSDLDGGPDLDADTDADTDSGTYVPCGGVYNDADYGVPIYSSPGHETGGYLFYYAGYDSVTGDITVDITCGSDTVQLDVLVLFGTIQVLDIAADGKRISITNHSSGPTTANVSIVVEDIPSSGPDGGVDGGVGDAGPGPDGGVVTPACTGVTNGAMYGQPLYTGYSASVGGYVVTNNGEVTGGIEVDIECGSDSSTVISSLYLPVGSTEVVYDVPADGKRIRLHNHSSSSLVSNISIIVEDL